jgi:hypothetical protein
VCILKPTWLFADAILAPQCPVPLEKLDCRTPQCIAYQLENWGFSSQLRGGKLYSLQGKATELGVLVYRIVSSAPQRLVELSRRDMIPLVKNPALHLDDPQHWSLRACEYIHSTIDPSLPPAGLVWDIVTPVEWTTPAVLQKLERELNSRERLSADDGRVRAALDFLLRPEGRSDAPRAQDLPLLLRKLGLEDQMTAAGDSAEPLDRLIAPLPKRAASLVFRNVVENFPMGESVVRLGLPEIWEKFGLTGQGVTSAFIDSGIDPKHPALEGKVVELRTFWENGDSNRHGTAVATAFHALAPNAAIISANRGERTPVWVTLAYWTGLKDKAYVECVDRESFLQDLNEASRRRPDILNLSAEPRKSDGLWSDAEMQPFHSRINALALAGTMVVVSAGNLGLNKFMNIEERKLKEDTAMLARADGAIAVGASDYERKRADFSSSGVVHGKSIPQVYAPGKQILLPCSDGRPGYCYTDGTSFSSPQLASLYALLIEGSRKWGLGLNSQMIAQLVYDTVKPMQNSQEDNRAGAVSFLGAVRRLWEMQSRRPAS